MKKLIAILIILAAVPVGADRYPRAGYRDTVLLCGASNQTLTTTGTTKQLLASCSIPANYMPGRYIGFTLQSFYHGAANTNSKTPAVEFSGTALANNASTASDEIWSHHSACYVKSSSEMDCWSNRSIKSGTSTGNNSTIQITGKSFITNNTVDFYATTPTAAGDVTLTGYSVFLVKAP